MHTALSLAPLTLAAVLLLSGVAKLGDPGSTASMIRLLRLPGFLGHRLVPRTLPVLELATAALLLTPWRLTYAVGAALSLGLFTAFLVVVARAMTFDPRPTCGCFGRVGDHRITGRTVGRNALLLALALVAAAVAVGGDAAGALVARYDLGDWLWLGLSVALAVVAVLVLGGPGGAAPRGRGRRDRARDRTTTSAVTDDAPQAEADYVRSPIPRGVLLSRDLEVRTLHSLARERAQLLVLANCWCGSTMEAVERLASWRERLPQLDVQLVHTLRPWDEPRLQDLDGVWWDPGAVVYDALGAGVSPAAVLLGADGLLAGGPVNGVAALEEFVADVEAELADATHPADAPA
ncbi:MauE/DoxX family redox-associated membrane protein [Ornithinimicrobium cerasi]|uniref:MauE/DoxX family redox-associated membrane protein n=1 Tax=Ornithinimicrobium cerasi TaxID=2248773 RepID=UPI000EFE89BB|nr:MauE/DoxX family redox-associated membrane protein [Ornithinimicrobium cerasi]